MASINKEYEAQAFKAVDTGWKDCRTQLMKVGGCCSQHPLRIFGCAAEFDDGIVIFFNVALDGKLEKVGAARIGPSLDLGGFVLAGIERDVSYDPGRDIDAHHMCAEHVNETLAEIKAATTPKGERN